MADPQLNNTLPTIHDVLIIGAGPSGLAVAARLREQTPSALYTDEEHRRFHWLRKHASRSSVKNRRTGVVRPAQPSSSSGLATSPRNILVLDAEGSTWLARWHRLFAALRISHLRSPMFFHPDPGDRDALLAFAHEKERTAELEEIANCVGKEISKHKQKKDRKRRRRQLCGKCGAGQDGKGDRVMEMAPVTVNERDRKDYFTPSRGMFGDFVDGVVERYGLGSGSSSSISHEEEEEEKEEAAGVGGMVREEKVEDVTFGVIPQFSAQGGSEKLFTVRTGGGGVHYAKAVVLAVGAGNAPCVPQPFGGIGMDHEAACHALTLRGDCGLPKALKAKVAAGERTNVVVVGGGLTSSQIGDLVLKQGVTKVWHLMRGTMKVKPFDIDLNWMSKFRNQEKAAFWMADDDYERAEMLKEARGGGSITPRFAKILQSHIHSGRTELHTNTTIAFQSYKPATRTWTLTTSPPIPSLPEIDHIYFATGVKSDISTLPFMQSMVSRYPLETYDGLPALTDDLAWREDVPLFCAGKFAGLRLGPGAANLEGARAGAERIVLAVEKILGSEGGGEGKERRDSGYEGDENGLDGKRYEAGLGSRYEALSMDE